MNANEASRTGEFLRILIACLWNKPAGASTRTLMDSIAAAARLTVEESSLVPGTAGICRYEVTTRQAMITLEKAGWLLHEDDCWLLTDAGRLVCKDFRDAADFYTESRRVVQDLGMVKPAARLTTEYARGMARQQINTYLQSLPRHEFRALVRDLLVSLGCTPYWVAPADKQRGRVDLVVLPDPLDAGVQILVQIRNDGSALSAESLQMLAAETHPGNRLLCICAAGFSEQALQFASTQAPARLLLMDLERFSRLWIEQYPKLPAEARGRFPLEAIHFLSPAE